MKFTDGYWQLRPGVTALYAQEAYDIERTDATADGPGLVVTAPTAVIARRGDTLNRAVLTTTSASALLGVIPTLIFFIIFQRTLTRGITAGAVK